MNLDPLEVQLHEATVDLLRAKAGRVTVFDGDVPTQPPADQQRFVLPYIVVWPPTGAPTERALTSTPTGVEWSPQITCAGGSPDRALHAIAIVRSALEGAHLLDGAGVFTETPTEQPIRRDPDTSPPRWYAPLTFTCLATPIEGEF